MPIFEYECTQCHNSFELLMRSDTRVACPACSSERVVRKLSLFAAHVNRGAESGPHHHDVPPCHTGGPGCDLGKCGSGFCGVD
jgi:putative FmdB family regulatory protein